MYNYYERLDEKVRKFPETKAFFNVFDVEQKLNDVTFRNALNRVTEKNNLFDASNIGSIKDFRIRKYSIAHFRKFNDIDGKPFLLNLTDDNDLCSLFLVGNNGSGKTSLFTGLEYIFKKGNISGMSYRKVKDPKDFLPYGNKQINDVKLKLILNEKYDGEYVVINNSFSSNFSTDAFFCCDADLYEIQKEDDLNNIFEKNLGLASIKNALIQLNNFISKCEKPKGTEIIFPKAYSNEMLQDDILYILCIDNDTQNIYIKLLHDFLSKVKELAEKHIESSDIGDIHGFITKLQEVLDKKDILTNLAFFKNNKKLLSNYYKVIELMEKAPMEASFFYSTLLPADVFCREMSNYFTVLSSLYSIDTMSLNKEQIRMKAVLKINELSDLHNNSRKELILSQENNVYESFSEDSIGHLKALRDEINKLYKKDWEKITDVCNITIKPILEKFTELSGTENEKVKIDADVEKVQVKILNSLIFESDKIFTTPKRFYNNFRLKLYSISVKVALAFMTMKLNSIKFPLIFDDVFTASDFDNSINIDEFFKIIFDTFEKIGLGAKKDLQIILFSHDEVVLNTVSSIIDTLNAERELKFISGILINPQAIDKDKDYSQTDNAYLIMDRL